MDASHRFDHDKVIQSHLVHDGCAIVATFSGFRGLQIKPTGSINSVRLTNTRPLPVGFPTSFGAQLRASQEAGVSSAIRLMGKFGKPGKMEQRYSRIGIFSRRQVSTTETIAATRGPACSLPMCIQLRRLWKNFDKRRYEQLGTWQSLRSYEAKKIRIFTARR